MSSLRSAIVAVQDPRNPVEWFYLKKPSPYVSALLIRLGVSANAATVLWGCVNMITAWCVYLAMTRSILFLPLVTFGFYVAEVLDTSDGEIARYNRTSSPIGGKLLDGICHKATEFALLAAYVLGAASLSPSRWLLAVALLLLSGEGMAAYAYERRLLVLRVYLQSKEKASGDRARDTYAEGARWTDLPWRHRVRTLTGLLYYRSIYPIVAVAAFAPFMTVWAVAALAVYKHAGWIRLIARSLRTTPRPAPVA